MTDTERLNELINKSGYKKKFIAEQLGITPFGLDKKITNVTEFKASEIGILCNLLQVKTLSEKERIFFVKRVDNMSTGKGET